MVIVLDKHKRPLGICEERRATILLAKRRACVYRKFPFTIIVKDKDVRNLKNEDGTPSVLDTYRIKIDPDAKHTGIAIVRERDNAVVLFFQIEHRGEQIVKALQDRNRNRRNRRSRETRYRKPKWGNKYKKKNSKFKADSPRPEGWLPPSVKSTADNIIHWVKKLKKLLNITSCSVEAVRFDTQLMDNPDIEGVQYQQGELFGYEVKEYLLDKYGHTCQYCGGKSSDSVLEWEHKIPKSRGGSDSVKNATLACRTCNQTKGNKTPEEWLDELQHKMELTDLEAEQVKGIANVIDGKNTTSNRYCAWVNSSRRYVEHNLFNIFGDVECSSGGKTKYNRTQLGLPKDHHYDALCVGNIPEGGFVDKTNGYCLMITAKGRGNRLRGNTNSCGVITVKYKDRTKCCHGIQSGDILLANVPKTKKNGKPYKCAGTWMGRVTIRKSGSFDINVPGRKGNVTVPWRRCKIIQRVDGYTYNYRKGRCEGDSPLT